MEILGYILIIYIFCIIYKLYKICKRKIIKKFKIKEYKTEETKTNKEENIKTWGYKKKDCILTEHELNFYKTLEEIAKKLDMKVLTQVALYEIITCNPNNFKAFQKIRYKTIDYVLTDKDLKIKVCIELDDLTHQRPDRIRRDNFINKLFQEVGIPLLRIELKQCYNITSLQEKIEKVSNMTVNSAD